MIKPDWNRTDCQEWMDLRNGRVLTLLFEDTETAAEMPRLYLEQYADGGAFETGQSDSRVWFHPEDLPLIVETLNQWLGLYRDCARKDADGPPPHPNWGGLTATAESSA